MAGVSGIARIPAGDHAAAAQALRRDGVAVIEDLWSAATIEAARTIVEAQHPEFSDIDQLEDYLGDPDDRFIAPVRVTRDLHATGLFGADDLSAICEAMLGTAFVFEAFGILMAQAGAKAQDPHRDGAILFPEATIDALLPPTAMTIAVPLVDIDADLAPTAAAPGSHRLGPGSSTADVVPITLDRGSAAIWDFWTLHAGGANRTSKARPALYFTACRPFWTDHANFRENARARLVGDPDVIASLGPRYCRARAS